MKVRHKIPHPFTWLCRETTPANLLCLIATLMRPSGYLHMSNVSLFTAWSQTHIKEQPSPYWDYLSGGRCEGVFWSKVLKLAVCHSPSGWEKPKKARALSLTLSSRRKSIPIWNCEYRPTGSISTLLTILHFYRYMREICIAIPKWNPGNHTPQIRTWELSGRKENERWKGFLIQSSLVYVECMSWK